MQGEGEVPLLLLRAHLAGLVMLSVQKTVLLPFHDDTVI